MNNREAFEAWIKKNYFNATEALAKQDNGNYYFHEASEKWTVWQAAIASQAQQPKMGSDSENILRLIATIQYMVGIAERGLGKKCNDDQMPERFLLDYVKSLEAQTQQTKKVMCEACHGSGYFDSDKDFDCQVCNGKGYLQSQAQQESKQGCKECDGQTYIHSPTGEYLGECPFCTKEEDPYAYDVPTKDGTELVYAIYFTKYNNPLPEGAIPLYASQQESQLPDISDLKRIAKELKTYIPEADEYKGKFIHKVWAKEIESALPPAPDGGDK